MANELIKQLSTKLTAFREDASGLVFEDCNHRLIRTLVHLSESPAASPSGDGVVVHITHQQLAQKVGVARETISLALAQLRRRNLLRTGRNQLTFQPQALRESNGKNPPPTSSPLDPAPAAPRSKRETPRVSNAPPPSPRQRPRAAAAAQPHRRHISRPRPSAACSPESLSPPKPATDPPPGAHRHH